MAIWHVVFFYPTKLRRNFRRPSPGYIFQSIPVQSWPFFVHIFKFVCANRIKLLRISMATFIDPVHFRPVLTTHAA